MQDDGTNETRGVPSAAGELELVKRFLHSRDPELVAQVVLLIESEASSVRQLSVLVLGLLGERRSIPAIVRHLENDPDPDTRATCAVALGSLGGKRARLALLRALTDAARVVRIAAARELVTLREAQVVPYLADMLSDADWHIRWVACEGLVALNMGNRELVHAIERLRSEPEAVRMVGKRSDFIEAIAAQAERGGVDAAALSGPEVDWIRSLDELEDRARSLLSRH